MLATGTRRRLAAQPERSREFDGAEIVRRGHAEDVAPRTPRPRHVGIPLRKTPAGKRAHGRPAGGLDPQGDARGTRELEAGDDAPAARAGGQEAERVVERELPVGDGVADDDLV